jgi:hypothetical protein
METKTYLKHLFSLRVPDENTYKSCEKQTPMSPMSKEPLIGQIAPDLVSSSLGDKDRTFQQQND